MPLGQALSADGNWLVVGYSDGTASLWDVAKRQEVLHWATSLHQFEAIVFAPDGSALALADGLSSLQVLQLRELRRQLGKLGLDW
jgi:WD40 repeat protein